MDPAFLRQFARRCREVMAGARTDAARQQLATWVEEFEHRADALERELAGRPTGEAKPG